MFIVEFLVMLWEAGKEKAAGFAGGLTTDCGMSHHVTRGRR
jgi:hypothetical protein